MRFITCVFFLMLGFVLSAQAPNGINYQAVIRDNTGSPVTNSSVGIQFKMLQGSAFGATVYQETHVLTTTNTGVASTVIGSGSIVFGVFANINWGAGPYFMEVAVDPNGGSSYAVVGTQQLMSVPYALHAKQADNVPTSTSQLVNDAGFVSNSNDADADPTNELQTIMVANDSLYLSTGGGAVPLSSSSLDAVTPITLINGASNFNTNFYNSAGYYVHAGRVYLQGYIFVPGGTTVFANLPAAVRPAKDNFFRVSGGSSGARVTVYANGNIQPTDGLFSSGGGVSLDGISYRIAP